MSGLQRFLATASFVVLCAPSGAGADTPASDPTDNIIVTASRAPLARAEVGSATTVIDRAQIDARQARYVTDLLRSVPGFAVSRSGPNGAQTQVRVRGAEANHVLVLIDGVRANDPASGDEFRWEYLSTSDIERIEIVRGPQSSLWGSDAVAAVVHVITRSGGKRQGISAYAEGGSQDTVNAALRGGAGSDRWNLGFDIERLDSDGSNIARSGTEADGAELLTAALRAGLGTGDAFSLDFSLRAVAASSQYDPVDFFTTGLPTDGDLVNESRQTQGHLTASLGTSESRWVHHLRVGYLDTDNENLAAGVEDASTRSGRLTLAYQADLRFGRNLLALAYEFEETDFSQRGEVSFGDPNQDQSIDSNSLVADFQGRPHDRLTWLLSARLDDYSDFEDALTGRLAAAWDAGDRTRLRASIGTGQKIPTFIERYGFFPGQFLGNPSLKPERSASVDLGIEQGFLDGELVVDLSLFHQDLEDEIDGFAFDPDSFLFTARNLPGTSRRSGIELGATLRAGAALELTAMYTYTDAHAEDASGNDIRELRRPRHSGSVGAWYRFREQRGSVALVADYSGTQTDTFFPPFPAPSETVTLPGHWIVDLTAGYDFSRHLNVFARISNLLDEDYEQVYGFRSPGRTAYLGVRLQAGR